MSASQDKIEITTPSGKVVVIRNYTTRADDAAAQDVINKGTKIVAGDSGEPVLEMTLEATQGAQDVYVQRLVESIDGSSDNIAGQLLELRSADYAAIDKAVSEIANPKG